MTKLVLPLASVLVLAIAGQAFAHVTTTNVPKAWYQSEQTKSASLSTHAHVCPYYEEQGCPK
jgi:hypothetical protein